MTLRSLIAVAGLALAVAGCNGGPNSDGSTDTGITDGDDTGTPGVVDPADAVDLTVFTEAVGEPEDCRVQASWPGNRPPLAYTGDAIPVPSGAEVSIQVGDPAILTADGTPVHVNPTTGIHWVAPSQTITVNGPEDVIVDLNRRPHGTFVCTYFSHISAPDADGEPTDDASRTTPLGTFEIDVAGGNTLAPVLLDDGVQTPASGFFDNGEVYTVRGEDLTVTATTTSDELEVVHVDWWDENVFHDTVLVRPAGSFRFWVSVSDDGEVAGYRRFVCLAR